MSTETLYVMTDPEFGSDAYITTWEEFKADCKELDFDPGQADLTELDEFLSNNKAYHLSKHFVQRLLSDAEHYGVLQQVKTGLEIDE